MKKEHLFYTASIILFCSGFLPLLLGGADWFWLALLLHVAAYAAFIIPALGSLSKSARKKYINAYILFAVVFIGGIPTIIVPFFAISIFIAATAYLITIKLMEFTARLCFYALSLGLSSTYFTVNFMNFMKLKDIQTDDVMYAIFGLVLGAAILLGLLVAFSIRGVIWLYSKKYRSGKIKGVNRYNKEIN